MNTVKNLDEVSFIRPLLVILLVFYHAFIIHAGGWSTPIVGLEKNVIFKWADLLSYSFMLETFVFISGYVFFFQFCELKKNQSVWELAKKKCVRLLLPCWVFSVIYVAAYGHDNTVLGVIRQITLGAGHLWFLPMLFWCFIWGGVIKKRVSVKILPIILLVALISYNPLPLRINQSMYYFLFFYLGMLAYQYKDQIAQKIFDHPKSIYLLWLLFVVLFVIGTLLNNSLRVYKAAYNDLIPRLLIQMAINLVQIIYSFTGLLCVYLTSLLVVKKREIKKGWLDFGKYCFAIYIFQQFILIYLYYHTSLITFVGSTLLSVVGFIITMGFSYVLAKVLPSL